MTTFRSTESGPVTIVTGRGQYLLGPGGEFESDDEAEVAALRLNPSLEEVGPKKRAPKKEPEPEEPEAPTTISPKSGRRRKA